MPGASENPRVSNTTRLLPASGSNVSARPCPGAWSGQGCSNLAPPFLYRSFALHGPNQHSMVGSSPVITQGVPHENH